MALILDGKTFAADAMVLALGITLTGEKVLLGFGQTATENETVCAAFLRELVDRGLRADPGLLCVIDGAKGLRRVLHTVFGAQAVIQRCRWHKRENVLEHLPKSWRATWRRKLQAAYERPSYPDAKAALLRVRHALRLVNESAVKSLDEGFKETPHLAPARGLRGAGDQPEDHQRRRIHPRPGRPTDGQGHALAHLGPEAALARGRAPRHRAAPPSG